MTAEQIGTVLDWLDQRLFALENRRMLYAESWKHDAALMIAIQMRALVIERDDLQAQLNARVQQAMPALPTNTSHF